MSNHYQELAPGSQPQTGSAGFGNDALEQMQPFDNFGLSDNPQSGNEFNEFFNFDAFTSDASPGQSSEPFPAAGADLLDFGPDNHSQLPANGFFFNDNLPQLSPNFQFPSSAGAEEVQQQLTSGAELSLEQPQLPIDRDLEDLFRQFPDTQAPASAGADHFQDLFNFAGAKTQHEVQDHHEGLSVPELHVSDDAENLEGQRSSGEETELVEPSPQHPNNNFVENFDQHVAEPQVPSAARGAQLMNQRSASAAPLVHQPQPDIMTVHNQLSNYLQTPGFSENFRHQFVETIPDHWMNDFFGAHVMPPTQRRATVPQVPNLVPQQAPVPAGRPTGRSQVPAPSSRIPPVLPPVPPPSFSAPAPLPRVRPSQAQLPAPLPQVPVVPSQQPAPRRRGRAPSAQNAASNARSAPRKPATRRRAPVPPAASYAQFAPQQSQREPTPTPPASPDGNLNQDTYEPLIFYPEFEDEPDAPPRQYPTYAEHFKTAGQAKRHRKRIRVAPKKNATDIERVKRYGRQYWVRRLYESMIDVGEIIDKDGSIHTKRFKNEMAFDPIDLEATAHQVFEQAILVHERGWNRPYIYYKKVVRGKLLDLSATSVESRLSRICELFRLSKAAVDDAVRGGIQLQLVCDNPGARFATKESNNAGNTKRSRSLAYMGSLEAAQGCPLSDEQLKEGLKRFAQMEREREEGIANGTIKV